MLRLSTSSSRLIFSRPWSGSTGRSSATRSSSTCCGSMPSRSTAWAAPDEAGKKALIAKFDALYPAKGRELNAELCELARLPGGAERRGEDARADGRRADAGRADRVRPGAARAQDGLDAGAAEGVLHLVPQGGELQGGQQPQGLLQDHERRRDGHADDGGERRAEAGAGSGPAGAGRGCDPAAALREEVDAGRTGAARGERSS